MTGGHYLLQGAIYPDDSFTLQSHDVITKCLSIYGLHNYEPKHLAAAIKLVHKSRDRYPYSELTGPRFPLSVEGITEALLSLECGKSIRPLVDPEIE